MLAPQAPRPMGTQCHLFDVAGQAKDPFLSAAARKCVNYRVGITATQTASQIHNDM